MQAWYLVVLPYDVHGTICLTPFKGYFVLFWGICIFIFINTKDIANLVYKSNPEKKMDMKNSNLYQREDNIISQQWWDALESN